MTHPHPLFPHRSLAAVLPTLLLLACGGSGDASASTAGERLSSREPSAAASGQAEPQERPGASRQAATQQATSSGILFDRELGRARCELLTSEMVAEVTGAPVGGLRQTAAPGICSYKWEGGRAELGRVVVSADAERAGRGFEQAYRTLSPQEAEAAAQAIREQVERQIAEGKITREQAQMTSGLVDAAGARTASARFEPVTDIGDRAVYEGVVNVNEMGGGFGTVVTLGSNASVLLGNMVFTVGVDVWQPEGGVGREPPPPEVMARNRELTLALARRMVEELVARR